MPIDLLIFGILELAATAAIIFAITSGGRTGKRRARTRRTTGFRRKTGHAHAGSTAWRKTMHQQPQQHAHARPRK